MELTTGDSVHAVLAERLPEALDDAIKKVHFDWHKACGRTTAEQISKAMPCCLPKANLCQQTKVPGIAKFNFQQWKDEGRPTLLKAGWIALCRMIASNADVDTECFRNIITLCDRMSIDDCENPDLKMAMEMSRGSNATRHVRDSSNAPKL